MAGPEVEQRNVSYSNNHCNEGSSSARRNAGGGGSSCGSRGNKSKGRTGLKCRSNSNQDDDGEGSSMISSSAGGFGSRSTCLASGSGIVRDSGDLGNNNNNNNNSGRNACGTSDVRIGSNYNKVDSNSNSFHANEILVDSSKLRASSTVDDIEQGVNLEDDGATGATGSGAEDGESLTKKHVRHKKKRPFIRRLITYIRNTIYGVRFTSSSDSELEELENLPPRYRPDSLSALCRSTKFSESEIKRIYRGFKAECPTGVVKEDTFKIIYASFFPQGANSGLYAHYVFNTLDTDHSGLVSFEEFVQGLSVLSRGTLEEKLRWTFSLYDINGDGYITREEMTDIVTAIFELVGTRDSCEVENERIKEKADRLFELNWKDKIEKLNALYSQKMDVNQDGVVTLEEFLDCCRNDETISKSIAVFDTTF